MISRRKHLATEVYQQREFCIWSLEQQWLPCPDPFFCSGSGFLVVAEIGRADGQQQQNDGTERFGRAELCKSFAKYLPTKIKASATSFSDDFRRGEPSNHLQEKLATAGLEEDDWRESVVRDVL